MSRKRFIQRCNWDFALSSPGAPPRNCCNDVRRDPPCSLGRQSRSSQRWVSRWKQVALRDLTLPGDLKKAFSQVAQARQEGLAALERARGETAALRNLANVAQLMERHPSLLQLRLLQTISERSGNTVVVGSPPNFGPIIPNQPSSAPPGEPAAE
jgi:hypothetical protein